MKTWITICCLVLASFSGMAEAGGGGSQGGGGGWHGGGGGNWQGSGGNWHGGGGNWHGGGWHGSVGVWVGAPFVFGAPFYYYPPYYYPYYPYPAVREYVYEQPAPASPPTSAAPQAPTWYYCRESRAYYPYVQECPGGWDSVPAQPPARGQ